MFSFKHINIKNCTYKNPDKHNCEGQEQTHVAELEGTMWPSTHVAEEQNVHVRYKLSYNPSPHMLR